MLPCLRKRQDYSKRTCLQVWYRVRVGSIGGQGMRNYTECPRHDLSFSHRTPLLLCLDNTPPDVKITFLQHILTLAVHLVQGHFI